MVARNTIVNTIKFQQVFIIKKTLGRQIILHNSHHIILWHQDRWNVKLQKCKAKIAPLKATRL